MALYALADLHLSLSVNKSMEVFGPAWADYVSRLEASLSQLKAEDTLVLAGDLSWGMNYAESEADFRFLERFPCRKLIVKGNHDYWWSTASKFYAFCGEMGFHTMELLHNNCFTYGDYALCGTRGWFLDEEQKPHDAKVLNRELGRLETSLKAAGEKRILCFLHYPPVYQGYECPEVLELLRKYGVRQCYYGHLHGTAIRRRIEGWRNGTEFFLISADHLGFRPKKICD